MSYHKIIFTVSQYQCYHYTTEETSAIYNGLQTERVTCESNQGFVFSGGDDTLAPGCGLCWCCQPGTIYLFLFRAREFYANS